MGFLVSGDWVAGEARDLGIHATPSNVRREFDRVRKQQFPKRRDFQAFLKQTKQTVQDLLLRVELNLLAQQLQKRAVAGHRSARSKIKALKEFEANFRRKWTSQTYCTPQYAVKDCGHVQAVI